MQLRHVSTNLRQGLRRNLSMHAAVILTLFVSLSLAGTGFLLNQQSLLTAEVLGNELQLTVSLCVPDDPDYPQCVSEVTAAQETAIIEVIDENPEADGYEEVSKEQGLQNIVERGLIDQEQVEGPDAIITAADVPKVLRINLDDPDEYAGIESALADLDGVRDITPASELVGPVFTIIDTMKVAALIAAAILVLSAVLLVANTIRLAALARRKEIEIMRLVGASRIFIVLPFLLEALFNAAVGVALSAGALAAFVHFGVNEGIAMQFTRLPFIDWADYRLAIIVIGIAGPALTILPTLLMTRKYLKF